MKKMKKILFLVTALAMAMSCVPGFSAMALDGIQDEYYYGSRLETPISIAFYKALDAMNQGGYFIDGRSWDMDMTDELTVSAMAYAEGDTGLLSEFGAAVDSFYYDHMELFYVDFDQLGINVVRNSSGSYQVSIGAGRTDTYLYKADGVVPDNIADQIENYNAELNELVSDVDTTMSRREIAKEVNRRICEHTEYSYGEKHNPKYGPYVSTAYGALVNGLAVCEGYSRLFKAAMDKLGVPCEIVTGYYVEGETMEPHMWNHVQDTDGKWYGIDVTMNDGGTRGETSTGSGDDPFEFERMFWLTGETFLTNHFIDGIVSSSGYTMPFPELAMTWESATESGLIHCVMENYCADDGQYQEMMAFDYDGLNATELAEERGLYMAFRTVTTNEGTNAYSSWQSAQECIRLYRGMVFEGEHKTYFNSQANKSIGVVEVGIFDISDDYTNSIGTKYYSEDAEIHHLVEALERANPYHDETYIAPAYVSSTEPEGLLQRTQDISKSQTITIVYDSPLRITDGEKPEIEWWVSSTTQRELSLDVVQKYAELDESSISFDGESTITFKFTPSRQYNHNGITYHFRITNMVNILGDEAESDGVAPKEFSIVYTYMDSFWCSRVFSDGRLKMNVYGQPSLIDNRDLSLDGWTFADGTAVEQDQRAQMMLVVNEPVEKEAEKLEDAVNQAVKETGGKVIVSKSYNINLNICGRLAVIPNGSYMRLNLGFPDGFDPSQEGVSFKLYHFRRDETTGEVDYGNPEEIECVVTSYGIIATVNSFSPFVLVEVESEENTSRGVVTDFNGKGGTVTADTGKPVNVLNREGESVTYTLTAEQGYEIEYISLNGVELSPEGAQGGEQKVTVKYEELEENNVLSVGYVAEAVRSQEEDAGVQNILAEHMQNLANTDVPSCEHQGGEATCSAKAICEVCGEKYGELDPGNHRNTELRNVKAATGTEEGYTGDLYCTDCGSLLEVGQTIPVNSSTTTQTSTPGDTDVIKSEVITNPDGSKTTRITQRDGTVTATTVKADGSRTVERTAADGTITLTEERADGVKVTSTTTSEGVTTATVTLPEGKDSVTVTVKVGNVTPGTVALKVKDGGEEEVIRQSVASEGCVTLRLEQSAELGFEDRAKTFEDVEECAEYASSVAFVSSRGLFNGVTGSEFAPAQTMTRGMLVTVLYRLDGEIRADEAESFLDVKPGAWYAEAVAWATSNEIVNGVGGGCFAPDDPLTIEQLCTMMSRYARFLGYDTKAFEEQQYTDTEAASIWAKESVNWAVGTGIIACEDGVLDPTGEATRGQVATVLESFVEYMLK